VKEEGEKRVEKRRSEWREEVIEFEKK